MRQKTILKQAVVLLLMALMIVSSGAVGTDTSTTERVVQNQATLGSARLDRALVWDNVVGVSGSLGGIIVATVRTEGTAFPADDFRFGSEATVESVFWEGGYFQCQLATGQHDYNWDWRVIFWSDDGMGDHPGSEIYNQTIPDALIARTFWYNYTHPDNGNTYWVAHYSADLPTPITFDANTKYWITVQGIQTPNSYPQACWARHNNTHGGILLHEAEILAAYWGYTTWTNISTLVTDHLPHDLNFQLYGTGGVDITPPVTTATLEGEQSGGVFISDVTVTLTATDDSSGVAYTKFNVDGGGWNNYSTPFIVQGNGEHTVEYYSVDNAGNVETTKSTTFTIQYPTVLSITLKGGLGVSAVIKNTGTEDLTNIAWSITLDGKLIFVGKTKSGTISALGVGEEVTVKDFVIGFGKTGIEATAGEATATAEGTALLFFVLGVK
ncbi:MAG: hypothetical protein WC525_05280 [Candidatus Thermoplasmatota archaeon]